MTNNRGCASGLSDTQPSTEALTAALSSPDLIVEYVVYLVLGTVAGFAAGLLGIGGGLVVVAPLAALLEARGVSAAVATHMAVATSLATIVVTASSSSWAHHRRGAVGWGLVRVLAPAVAVGSVAGGLVAAALPARGLEAVVGGVAAVAGVRMWFGATPVPGATIPSAPWLFAAGIVIGVVSAMVGIGGGVMSVPLLAWWRIPLVRAVGTSAALGLPIALAGSTALMVAGMGHPLLPPGATGFVYWPAVLGLSATTLVSAPLGARLAHALPPGVLARVFGVYLVLVAGYLWAR